MSGHNKISGRDWGIKVITDIILRVQLLSNGPSPLSFTPSNTLSLTKNKSKDSKIVTV